MTLSKQKSKQRDPPPSLFLHPSPGASYVSIPGILGPNSAVAGPATIRRERTSYESNTSVRHTSAAAAVSHKGTHVSKGSDNGWAADRTDALWAEMQATLEEVELSASAGTHVFGRSHDGKLAELRAAQIALAQAWARSEADGPVDKRSRDEDDPNIGDDLRSAKGSFADGVNDSTNEAEVNRSSVAVIGARSPSDNKDVERLGSKPEGKSEADIVLARKRREANDEYFQHVNAGVIDVVSKLEQVAIAMRVVEHESRDVWTENVANNN